ACPSSPDNVKTVREVAGLDVQQVCIGSCTNSSYRDLMTAAAILRGRRLPAGTELIVAPGSRQVVINVLRDGGLADLLAAGARLDECACGFCIGAAQAPATGSVSVRTNNRNFSGRSGTSGDQVYLVSPETAAATALAGKLTDPRTLGKAPVIESPETFLVDDSMLVVPAAGSEKAAVLKGPNIGDPPSGEPLPDELIGRAALKVGDKITTDHIMPAGKLLRLRSNIPEYAKHVFENVDAEFAARAAALRDQGLAAFIVGGLSYGQGSSREHAAICPRFLGVRAVLARSFERIHTANLVNFGILPLVFADEADYDRVSAGDELRLTGLRKGVAKSGTIEVEDVTQGFTFTVKLDASERARKILLAGGLLNVDA
ncbi:MAG: aconitate hydratase, partial [Planctomycetes bacterium]|nr:aconitate hydratase [Planctomycetota bacterium]